MIKLANQISYSYSNKLQLVWREGPDGSHASEITACFVSHAIALLLILAPWDVLVILWSPKSQIKNVIPIGLTENKIKN